MITNAPKDGELAAACGAGDPQAIARVTSRPLKARSDNLVARPWGGRRLRAYKGLAEDGEQTTRFGEAFELCADPDDPEASAHPSIVTLDDGSEIELPRLLQAAPREILGRRLAAAHGPRLPVLPKTLDIAELLSVQAHPSGYCECYVIIEADAGATIRLGFKRAVNAQSLARDLHAGRKLQKQLLHGLRSDVDPLALQALLASNFNDRVVAADRLLPELSPLLPKGDDPNSATEPLRALKRLYWQVLDMLNTIPVQPGQVIYNATPERLARPDRPRSAEVHALGNPEGHEILALEIRRPAPTLRAWDHVRFPRRKVDIDGALEALGLHATSAPDFVVQPQPLAGQPGVRRSVADDWFTIDHLELADGAQLRRQISGTPQTLHVTSGALALLDQTGATLARLGRGESALLPVAMGTFAIRAEDDRTRAVAVTLNAPKA